MTPTPFVDSSPGLSGDRWSVPGVTGQGAAAPPRLPTLSQRVARLQQLLLEEAAVVPTELPGAQALADTAGLLAARAQLDRLLMARVGDVETRGLAALEGAPTTASWLRQQAGDLPVGTVATARRLARHVSLGRAVAEGRLATKRAEQVGKALAKVRPELDRDDGLIDGQDAQPVLAAVLVDGLLTCLGEAFGGLSDDSPKRALLDELGDQLSEIAWQTQTGQLDRLERGLVLLAEHLPAGWLAPSLAKVTGALLPTRLEDAAAKAERDRRLTLTPLPDGGGHVCGQLSPECFELLHTALAAAAETDEDNPGDTDGYRAARDRGWLPGDELPDELPDSGPRVRCRPQRLHDALVIALRRLLDSAALGSRGKAAPHVSVTVALPTLHGAPGGLPATGASGHRLPLALVNAWMHDAWITRYVLDLRHRVVETSHTERTLKAHERRIKVVETGGACQSACCPRGPNPPPGTRLVPHHPDAYARTGTTSVLDTALLCEQEHGQLHRGATLTLRDGRRINAQGWVR